MLNQISKSGFGSTAVRSLLAETTGRIGVTTQTQILRQDDSLKCGIRSFEITEARISQECFELTEMEGLRRDQLIWLITFINSLIATGNDAHPVEPTPVIAPLHARKNTSNTNDEADAGAADDASMSQPTFKRNGMPPTSNVDFATDEHSNTSSNPWLCLFAECKYQALTQAMIDSHMVPVHRPMFYTCFQCRLPFTLE
jgi:hypothetical protein